MNTTVHVGIVVNPSKTSKDSIEDALASLDSEGDEPRITWYETSVDDPGHGMAQEALDAGATVVIAAGGDGTVRAVAGCLAENGSDASLAVVPLGTGNLLARNLEIPVGDLAAALEVALHGHTRSIDVGWAMGAIEATEHRYAFTVMAGVGIDAHMITETNEDLKDKVGWLAYVESLGRAFSESDVVEVDFAIDGAASSNTSAHTLIVGNCGTLTGGVTLLPDAVPDDGELDLLVLSADGVGGWLDTMRSMVWDNGVKRMVMGQDEAESSESVEHQRVSEVAVSLGEPRVLELDGDDVGECAEVAFSIQPGAITVRVPHN
ncbi:diacylglycerol/lipid kinase family protein [Demequina flava]|uniref:diacylglycerol/lipid kinase family protein n=1 Tax=Demequina flava TaxID=1095025 RepID=UPI000ACCBDB6|nr:diacylglycerol kinase family protein [Demequina flava]